MRTNSRCFEKTRLFYNLLVWSYPPNPNMWINNSKFSKNLFDKNTEGAFNFWDRVVNKLMWQEIIGLTKWPLVLTRCNKLRN